MKKLLTTLLLLFSLSGCVTIPEHMIYQVPDSQDLNVSSIVGSKQKAGLLSSSIVNVYAVDEKLVNKMAGARHNKVTFLHPGLRRIIVDFASGAEYVGRGEVVFQAEPKKSYQLVFEYPAIVEIKSPKLFETEPENDDDQSIVDLATKADEGGQVLDQEGSSSDEANEGVDKNTAFGESYYAVEVWVIDAASQERVSDRVMIPVQYVPTVVIPIFI